MSLVPSLFHPCNTSGAPRAGQHLVMSQEEEPVGQEDPAQPLLRKCLLTDGPVFVKTKLWLHVHKIELE